MPYVVTEACMLCGACVAGCESGAIEEGETQSHINVDLCVECGTCARNCPFEAIIFVDEVVGATHSHDTLVEIAQPTGDGAS